MATLTTDFIKVAQSGPTVDGRTIEPQELREMAETYNPDTYTAVIWPDHERFWGNHGTVLAVEVRENGDLTELFAQLQPGFRFLEKNQQGQKQFSSIEIWPDFGNSGKCYLGGIAITDSPASLGTEQIRLFTAQRGKDADATRFRAGVELPHLFSIPPNNADQRSPMDAVSPEDAEALSFMRGLLRKFGFQKSETDSEEPMDAKQFSELSGKVDALAKQVEAFAAKPREYTDAAAAGQSGAAAPATAPVTDTVSAPEGAPAAAAAPAPVSAPAPATDMNTQLSTLTDSMGKLATSFATMAQRMEGVQASTRFETSGPAADAADVL